MADQMVAALAPLRVRLSFATIAHHVWNLAPIILAHVGAVVALFLDSTWREWLWVPALVYVRGFFVTAGYHRYFAHRGYKTSRVMQFFMAFFCCANLQQGPLWWALYHRHHHRHSDEPADVHSPYQRGFFWAHCGWLFVPLDPEWHYVSDLRRYPELVWLERFWQIPGILLAGLCWWVGGWNFLCIGFCFSAAMAFQLTSSVNSIAHLFGSRRYNTPDDSRNSFLLAMITMGEGWHNNHHHYPHTAQAGFFWWQIDGTFRLIWVMERLGLVWDVRRVPHDKLYPAATPPAVAPPVAIGTMPDTDPVHS